MRRLWVTALAIGHLCACATAQARLPYGADKMDQSAFALGTMALNVLFVESNGTIDPNQEDWTAEQLGQIRSQIDLAVDFWEGQTSAYHPNAQLSFTVNYINGGVPLEIGQEPITRAGNQSSVNAWAFGALSQVFHDGRAINNVTRMNEVSRAVHDTNWAVTLLIVNDFVDEDNRFSNLQFAFAGVGGPYIAMTYGNDGWGIDRFHRVLAHELGHTFYALDEYEESRVRNTVRSGYLNGVNGNAERDGAGNIIAAPQPHALMLDNTLDMSPFTQAQVGHVDTDSDGVPDILDSPPVLKDVETDSDPNAGWFRFRALAEVTALPNLNTYNLGITSSGNAMTINWIDGAEYRVDMGDWIPFAPSDGGYGDYVETLDVMIADLDRGQHVLDFRARNSVDLYSDAHSFVFMSHVPEPASAALAAIAAVAWFVACRERRERRRSH